MRATTSASATSTAPTSAEPRISARCDGPISMRTAWGMTSPTNKICPATAVAPAAARAAANRLMMRIRSTGMPRCWACASPSDTTSSARPILQASAMPPPPMIVTSTTSDHDACASEPSVQNTMPRSWASLAR